MSMQPHTAARPLAIVTGASSGIGYNLAWQCAHHGYDLLIASDEAMDEAASDFQALGAQVDVVQTDLSTPDGVDALLARLGARDVDALLANAGHGLGHAFLEQSFADVQHVIGTNITGTIYLLHSLVPRMCARRQGRVLITGSIAGLMPGSFQAVYNGTKAFIDSFSFALRDEIKDSGVTVTCLMPGATDTHFFARADMLDTKVGAAEDNMDPAEVAKTGFEAMQKGEGDVVAGLKNKVQAAVAHVTPSGMLAAQHRKMAEPGTAEHEPRVT